MASSVKESRPCFDEKVEQAEDIDESIDLDERRVARIKVCWCEGLHGHHDRYVAVAQKTPKTSHSHTESVNGVESVMNGSSPGRLHVDDLDYDAECSETWLVLLEDRQ